MYKNLLRASVSRLITLLAVGAALTSHASHAAEAPAQPPAKAPLKVAFVYVSPVGTAGWTYQHNLGRLAMEQSLGAAVQTTYVENVAEGPDSERVMRDLAGQGYRLIFATSFGYLDPALKVAADFPAVRFEHMGGYKTSANLNTYNARFYEGRYLAGYLAGRMSKTGVTGYVAGFPIPEVIQGINAYTLGMRAANPQAQVRVSWLNTWFDPAKEREAAQALIDQGADTLTHHSGSTAIPQLAEEKGVMLLGYQSDMSAYAPTAQLTSVTHVWGKRYTEVAQAVAAGRWKPQPYWGGLREGVIKMAPLAKRVPTDIAHQFHDREREVAMGRLQPFGGKLVDQAGQVRQASGHLSDAAIARMDFFVQGVVGSLPKP
ncbi:MAG: BMP family ABC transporter substrate-binding protein [Leptothrix sp. (in: b-proteobacteria)]